MAYNTTYSPSEVNTVALAVTMTGELEKALVAKSVTGVLGDGGLKSKFMGNGIVVVADADMQALGDYNRDTGFVDGAITISHTPYQLSQDRGRSFDLDRQDADESGVANLAGQIMGEFVRTKVVPEADAYILSKIVGFASSASHVEAIVGSLNANTIYGKIISKIAEVQDASGYDEDLVIFADKTVWAALQTSSEVSRVLHPMEVKKGEVTFTVQGINGVPIIPVPSVRMKSAYTFLDGIDHSSASGDDESDGGFEPADGAVSVGFVILPKKAVSVVRKQENTRIFTPDQNQRKDAWRMDYRLYYDVFLRGAYADTIYALTYGNEAPDPGNGGEGGGAGGDVGGGGEGGGVTP